MTYKDKGCYESLPPCSVCTPCKIYELVKSRFNSLCHAVCIRETGRDRQIDSVYCLLLYTCMLLYLCARDREGQTNYNVTLSTLFCCIRIRETGTDRQIIMWYYLLSFAVYVFESQGRIHKLILSTLFCCIRIRETGKDRLLIMWQYLLSFAVYIYERQGRTDGCESQARTDKMIKSTVSCYSLYAYPMCHELCRLRIAN